MLVAVVADLVVVVVVVVVVVAVVVSVVILAVLCSLFSHMITQAMVHCGSVRQTAAIVSMDKEHVRTGDKTIARLKFVRSPEYLRPGTKLVFREGRTKAVGQVMSLC